MHWTLRAVVHVPINARLFLPFGELWSLRIHYVTIQVTEMTKSWANQPVSLAASCAADRAGTLSSSCPKDQKGAAGMLAGCSL